MTEYDYSPGAYERYLAKQQAIARWVDDTVRYPPANPFLPSIRGEDSARAQDPPSSPLNSTSDSDSDNLPPHHYHRHHHHRGPRDHHGHRHHRHHHSHRVRAEHGHGSTRQRSSSLPSSTASPYGVSSMHTAGYGPQQHPYGSTPAYDVYNPGPSYNTPIPSNPAYYPNTTNAAYVRPPPGQPLVLPIQGGTGGYVVVPPKGTSYQVVNQAQYQSSAPQPWYKRVFSPTPSGKSSKTSSNGSRKQSSKWSWDIY